MTIAVEIEVAGVTQQQYAGLLEVLQPKLTVAPGFLTHVGTAKPDGLSLLELWRSKEDYEAFVASVKDLLPKEGIEVHIEEISKHLTPAQATASAGQVHPVGNDAGEEIKLGPITILVKEDGSRTRETLAVAEFRGTDFKIPPHTHTEHDEVIYVVEGEMQMMLGEKTFTCKAGDSITIPIGVPHSTMVEAGKHVRFLNMISPARYLDYFQELALAIKAGGFSPATAKPVMLKFGLQPIAPR